MSTPAAETATFVELLKQISSVQSPEQLLDTCENLEKFLEARRGKNIAHLFSVDLVRLAAFLLALNPLGS